MTGTAGGKVTLNRGHSVHLTEILRISKLFNPSRFEKDYLMYHYTVKLAYYPDGSGSTMTTHVYADSEFHACQLAQANNPGMYALSATRA